MRAFSLNEDRPSENWSIDIRVLFLRVDAMKRDSEEKIRELAGHRVPLEILLRWLMRHKVDGQLWPCIDQEGKLSRKPSSRP